MIESTCKSSASSFGDRIPWDIALLFVVVVLTRLPFARADYGLHADAWRVARVARQWSETGIYEVSRFPGSPVHEFICSLLWRGGPLALNGVSIFSAALAAVIFTRILQRAAIRNALLAGLALSFVPVFFVQSVTTKDHLPALALGLGAMLAAQSRRPLLAGLLLGFAGGVRVGAAVFALPVAALLFYRAESLSKRLNSVVIAAITALITLCACFWPTWATYGTGFLRFHPGLGRPTVSEMFYTATIGVWEWPGVIAIGLGSIGLLVSRFRTKERISGIHPLSIAFALLGVATALVFLIVPLEPAYCIPAIPAVIYFLEASLPRVWFTGLAAMLVLAPWLSGSVLKDKRERAQQTQTVKTFVSMTEARLPGQNTIVVGGWEPIIGVLEPALYRGHNHYIYLLAPEELRADQTAGRAIYYTPAMLDFERRVYGVDLKAEGATDLRDVFARRPK